MIWAQTRRSIILPLKCEQCQCESQHQHIHIQVCFSNCHGVSQAGSPAWFLFSNSSAMPLQDWAYRPIHRYVVVHYTSVFIHRCTRLEVLAQSRQVHLRGLYMSWTGHANLSMMGLLLVSLFLVIHCFESVTTMSQHNSKLCSVHMW